MRPPPPSLLIARSVAAVADLSTPPSSEKNLSAAPFDAGGADHAAVVDGGGIDVAVRLEFGGGRLDSAFVVDFALTGAHEHALTFDRNGEDFDIAAGGQANGAFRCVQRALVADLVGDQENVAAVDGGDGAEVDDAGGRGARKMQVAAGEKVAVGKVEGRGDEAGGVDAASGTDQDAIGIEQDQLAVGAQSAVDGTGQPRR